MIVATISFMMTRNMKITNAADLSQFKAGNIMSDAVMRNYTSMTEAEIQSFLNRKNSCDKAASSVSGAKAVKAGNDYGVPYNYQYVYGGKTYHYHVENGKFVCLNKEKFNGETAAHIIYQAAQDYKINPQVLIVLLEKEQGLITDKWPNANFQYRSATGYGCPDNAACNSKYYGLKNQIRNAAALFNTVLSGGWTNYPLGNNTIRYSPNASCGSSIVKIENLATSALYRYTPYQPNAAALKAYTGTATCGAYGNRNFYIFFTDWFGSTQKVQYSYAQNYYNQHKGSTGLLTGETNCVDGSGKAADLTKDGNYACYQDFEKGTLFWNTNIKSSVKTETDPVYFETQKANQYKKLSVEQRKDPIFAAWLNSVNTVGEFNTSAKSSTVTTFEKDKNYRVLKCEKGVIFGNNESGYNAIKNQAFDKYTDYYETLGPLIVGWSTNPNTKIEWYQFKNGYVVGTDEKGWFLSMGKTRNTWAKQRYEYGKLGFPKSDIEELKDLGYKYQTYENGTIVGNDTIGYFDIKPKAYDKWLKYASTLGHPIVGWSTNPNTKIEWYQFKNGYVVGTDEKGWFLSMGKTREVWAKLKYEYGPLGFPKSDFENNPNTGIEWQIYENGYIVGNDEKGWFESRGSIRKKWQAAGYEYGKYGFPKSNIEGNRQLYEGGWIYK